MEIIHNKNMIFKKFIDENKIRDEIQRIANNINKDYRNKNPLIIGILNGSFMFLSDISKLLTIDCEITFMKVKSYNGTNSTGKVESIIDLKENIGGRDLIVVEDIVDSGLTIDYIKKNLYIKKPRSVKICSLFFKQNSYKYSDNPDYIGFNISDEFIIGYGLDYNGKYRNLKDIYKLN